MDDSYREIRCGLCTIIFYLCQRCDRGQCYCRDLCRREARLRSCRAARARHQASEEGRLDHRDRQRAYRARRKLISAGVTDQGSPSPPDSIKVPAGADRVAPTSPPSLPGGTDDGITDPESPVRCAACGRRGRFIRFAPLAWLRSRSVLRRRIPSHPLA